MKHFEKVTRFVNSKKGMITQRKTGIIEAGYVYLLLMDDDIVLKSGKAVENLFFSLVEYGAKCAVPFSPDGVPKGIKKIIYALFGIAVPTHERYLRYLPSGGQYYPAIVDFKEPYAVEGGSGICIAVRRDFLVEHKIYGDVSLEDISYPLREDGAFILSIVLNGGKAIMIDTAPYEHLGSGRASDHVRLLNSYEAAISNNYLFWRKYIRDRYKNHIFTTISFVWFLIGNVTLAIFSVFSHKTIAPLKGVIRGFVRTCNYRKAPKIVDS